MSTFILIHSPLVGPMTWAFTADALRRKGHQVLVPSLFAAPDTKLLYWQQHANAVAQTVESATLDAAPILVAHSGAGPLLPAIEQTLHRPVSGSIFVDAGLPKDHASRLELIESAEEVQGFRAAAVDGLLPTWTDEDLRQVIHDDEVRREFVAELRPLPLAIYEEPLPVFAGWPDAPCAYLQFSTGYDSAAHEAQARGWPYMKLDGGHFHMLVAPDAVADALIDLAAAMGLPTGIEES